MVTLFRMDVDDSIFQGVFVLANAAIVFLGSVSVLRYSDHTPRHDGDGSKNSDRILV